MYFFSTMPKIMYGQPISPPDQSRAGAHPEISGDRGGSSRFSARICPRDSVSNQLYHSWDVIVLGAMHQLPLYGRYSLQSRHSPVTTHQLPLTTHLFTTFSIGINHTVFRTESNLSIIQRNKKVTFYCVTDSHGKFIPIIERTNTAGCAGKYDVIFH